MNRLDALPSDIWQTISLYANELPVLNRNTLELRNQLYRDLFEVISKQPRTLLYSQLMKVNPSLPVFVKVRQAVNQARRELKKYRCLISYKSTFCLSQVDIHEINDEWISIRINQDKNLLRFVALAGRDHPVAAQFWQHLGGMVIIEKLSQQAALARNWLARHQFLFFGPNRSTRRGATFEFLLNNIPVSAPNISLANINRVYVAAAREGALNTLNSVIEAPNFYRIPLEILQTGLLRAVQRNQYRSILALIHSGRFEEFSASFLSQILEQFPDLSRLCLSGLISGIYHAKKMNQIEWSRFKRGYVFAMMIAAEHGNLGVLRDLVRLDSFSQISHKDFNEIVQEAIENEQEHVVIFLTKLKKFDEGNDDLLWIGALMGSIETLKILFSWGSFSIDAHEQALHAAASLGREQILRFLIRQIDFPKVSQEAIDKALLAAKESNRQGTIKILLTAAQRKTRPNHSLFA